jgi:hypothetical protein
MAPFVVINRHALLHPAFSPHGAFSLTGRDTSFENEKSQSLIGKFFARTAEILREADRPALTILREADRPAVISGKGEAI